MSLEERNEFFEAIKQNIDNLVEDINSFEKIRLLGGLGGSLNGGLKVLTPTVPNIIETSIEYAISIALGSENDINLPTPSAEDIGKIFGQLREIREQYIKYIYTENNITKYTGLEQKLRTKVIEKTLTVRGEGHQVHIEEIFLEMFGLHEDFLLKHYKFSPSDILNIIDYTEDQVTANQILVKEEHRDFLRWFKAQDLKRLARQYGYGDPFLPSKVYQIETGHRPRFKEVQDQFRFVENELDGEQANVIRALSLQFGENSAFLDTKIPALPLKDTLTISKPILFDSKTSSYFCFLPKVLRRNMFNIAEGLIARGDEKYFNEVYRGKKSRSKSAYFESKVFQLFKRIVPHYAIHSNLKYDVNDELDILIESKSYIYLIEVKSGSLTNQARRGAIESLKGDITKLVGEAAFQTARAEAYILYTTEPSFRINKGEIFSVNKSKSVIKIIVSFASINGVTNQLSELAKMGVISDMYQLPLMLSVFDLMVLADIFDDDENGFLEYVNVRVALYKTDNLVVDNELDFLGLFLSRTFKKVSKAVNRGEHVVVGAEHRNKLDIYYKALYEGKSTKKPRKIAF